jgi:hypothetical protein
MRMGLYRSAYNTSLTPQHLSQAYMYADDLCLCPSVSLVDPYALVA